MDTNIPQEVLDKLGLKVGDPVAFEYKGKRANTHIGKNVRIGLTRIDIKELGYMDR